MPPGDESITITSFVETRTESDGAFPVWERVITASHDVDDTDDVTQALNLNGLLRKIIFKIPNYTNGITGQLVIKDNGDNTIFDSGELAKSATHTFNLDEPLTGEIDVVMGISGAAGGSGGDMVATLRGV